MHPLKLHIMGTGRVAQHWLKAFSQTDIGLSFSGRNTILGAELSEQYQVEFHRLDHLPKANVYLICCADEAIAQLSQLITYPDVLVAHGAGAFSADILQGPYRKAVVYPLQSFSHDQTLDYSQIPLFIESSSDKDFELLKRLFGLISTNIKAMDAAQRQYLHLAAVFACNFSNHMIAQSQQICQQHGLDFKDLMPLLEETLAKIKYMPAKEAQTGPAKRQDFATMQKHQNLLENPHQQAIYELMSQSIMRQD